MGLILHDIIIYFNHFKKIFLNRCPGSPVTSIKAPSINGVQREKTNHWTVGEKK